MSGIPLVLNDNNYRIAFTVESYLHPKKQKRDPRFIKYLFRLYGKRNGIYYDRILDYHNCTEADYNEFHPVKSQSEQVLLELQTDPDRGMLCLDWNDEEPIEIIGADSNDDYTRLEVVLTPCNYIHTALGNTWDSVHPECVTDLES